jgi:glutamine amidotransferase
VTSIIGVINLEMGNLRSVMNALNECGLDTAQVDTPEALDRYSHLVLPGVGHFRAGVEAVDNKGFREPLHQWVANGNPLLGLCVGMQLMADTGTEGGVTQGLGLVPGEVRRIPDAPGRAIPHVGWNALDIKRYHPVLGDLKPDRDFYFVHSYSFHCASAEDLVADTDYGVPLAAIVAHGSAIGLQFHPEKSQLNGLKLLENFGYWDGKC